MYTSLYIARKAISYADGVHRNILCGGDNGSRGVLVGGMLAAAAAPASELPPEWLAADKAPPALFEEVRSLAQQVLHVPLTMYLFG